MPVSRTLSLSPCVCKRRSRGVMAYDLQGICLTTKASGRGPPLHFVTVVTGFCFVCVCIACTSVIKACIISYRCILLNHLVSQFMLKCSPLKIGQGFDKGNSACEEIRNKLDPISVKAIKRLKCLPGPVFVFLHA